MRFTGPLFCLLLGLLAACGQPHENDRNFRYLPRYAERPTAYPGDSAWQAAAYARAARTYGEVLRTDATLGRVDSLYLLNRMVWGNIWSEQDTTPLRAAIEYLRRAERDTGLVPRIRGDLAMTLARLAYLRYDLASAKEQVHTALARYPGGTPADSLRIAQARALLGLLHRDSGDFADSIPRYADPAATTLARIDSSSLSLVEAYLALAKAKWNQRDYEFALAYAAAAYRIQQQFPEPYRRLRARLESNLADMLHKRASNQPDDSLWQQTFLTQATAYAERSVRSVAGDPDPWAQAIRQVYVTIEADPVAMQRKIDSLELAARPARRYYAHPDFLHAMRWLKLRNLDSVLFRMERFAAAAEPSGLNELDNANFILRFLYTRKRDFSQSMFYAMQGLALLHPPAAGKSYDDPDLLRRPEQWTIPELNALGRLAIAIVDSGHKTLPQLRLAYRYFSFVDEYWFLRIPAANPESALRLIDNVGTAVFEKAMETSWLLYEQTGETTYRDAVFYFGDRLRSFVLYRELVQANVSEETAHIDRLLITLRDRVSSREGLLNPASQSYRLRLLRERERLSERLNQDTVNFRRAVLAERVELERIGRQELLPDQALLQYTVHGPYLYTVYIDRDSVKVLRTEDGRAVLGHLDTLNAILADTGPLYTDRARGYLRHATTLYRLLIGQTIGALPQRIAKVVLIPGGELPLFPADVLLTEPVDPDQLDPRRWPYWLHRADVRLAASYKLFAYHRERRQRADYQGDIATWISDDLLDPMADLLTAVQQLYPGRPALFAGREGNSRTFRRHAGDYTLLQCILHARGSRRSEYGSRLRFGPEDFLYGYELIDLPLDGVDLLILAACETSVGKSVPGEGNYNFVRYVQRAGVAEIVASLWKLPDTQTAELLARFHAELAAGRSPLVALGVAKRTFVIDRRQEREAFPSQWAGVVLY